MCGKNGKVVIIDFGLASNKRKRFPDYNVLKFYCNDKDLRRYQNMLINVYFNPQSNAKEKEEYKRSIKNWEIRVSKLCDMYFPFIVDNYSI